MCCVQQHFFSSNAYMCFVHARLCVAKVFPGFPPCGCLAVPEHCVHFCCVRELPMQIV
eukprot:GDKH01019553.1.p3 GENE.GDKH01019553.1~~GDKH01019553.1.p3  ORF type:complete len:58 (-),score=1.14 GDKH01019553.1:17-190(-)